MIESLRTILLVDPDPHARSSLATVLAPVGLHIVEASDGNAALTVLNGANVHLVITELYVAAGGHADLIAAIRANPSWRKTRTMAHTHRALRTDRDWAEAVGADAYILKPTRAERLRYVVGRLTTERGANASRRKVVSTGVTASPGS